MPAIPATAPDAAVVPGATQLGLVETQAAEVAGTGASVTGVLAPLLIGGALLAGVLGISAQERRRRLLRR